VAPASSEKARFRVQVSADLRRALLKAIQVPEYMAKFKFDVVFDYAPPRDDPGNTNPNSLKLDAVLLNLDFKSGTCAELTSYLKSIYGKPDRTFASGPTGFLWHRKELGDDIQYSTWNERKSCTVMYMPLGAPNH
jgi:hypothetical protein